MCSVDPYLCLSSIKLLHIGSNRILSFSKTTNSAVSQYSVGSGVPRNFVRGGGVQQIQLRTDDRENGNLGYVAP